MQVHAEDAEDAEQMLEFDLEESGGNSPADEEEVRALCTVYRIYIVLRVV